MDDHGERVVAHDSASELVAVTMGVYSVPRVIERVDALVTFPGLGEWWRVREAIRWWQREDVAARFLLITGHNTRERTSVILDQQRLRQPPFSLERVEGVYFAIHAEHTREQAEWVVDQTRQLGIVSLALFVSPYHLVRAYLTLLKAYLKRGGSPLVMIPAPVSIPPSTLIPETAVDAWAMVSGEVGRIVKYQRKGDVATLQELQDYLNWLWTQPIVAPVKIVP